MVRRAQNWISDVRWGPVAQVQKILKGSSNYSGKKSRCLTVQRRCPFYNPLGQTETHTGPPRKQDPVYILPAPQPMASLISDLVWIPLDLLNSHMILYIPENHLRQ